MSRRPRFPVTGYPLHAVQRGNDRQPCFFAEADYLFYLDSLGHAAQHYSVQVHAYVLMTNHIHLLVTPLAPGAVSRMMQSLGARYVRYVNARQRRTGTLWEGRYKACLVDHDRRLLATCRYIDLNPVRAGIVAHPIAYRWSSFAGLIGQRHDRLLMPRPVLTQLGDPPGPGYARWCGETVDDDELARLRDATNHELAFGNDRFKAQIEAATSRRTSAAPRGRGAAGRRGQLDAR